MTAPAPALPFDVLCLSSIDWNDPWQGQQEIMSRLARAGAEVLFVENTGVREPRPTDARRIIRRVGALLGGPSAVQPVTPGIRILSPAAVPLPWNPVALMVNRRLFVDPVVRATRRLKAPLIWCFLPTPAVVEVVRALRRHSTAVVYYCVSDFAAVVRDPTALRRSEDELLAQTDVVFVNGQRLAARFEGRHGNVRIHPFGADITKFTAETRRSEPADLAQIPRPRAGYIGLVHRHLAPDWIEAAATALPNTSFVLVGRRQPDAGTARIERLPNVHFLGPRPHSELPGYVQGFDVCLIPYQLSEYTSSVVPTKLFEYMAMGKPVVTTRLPELAWILDGNGAVTQTTDAAGFARAVRGWLATPPDPAAREANRQVAVRYSWDSVVDAMLGEIARAAQDRS